MSDGRAPEIEPDTKNWTWVIDRRCPECGFDGSSVAGSQVAARLRSEMDLWQRVLAEPGCDVRPRPTRWSAVEYGCHVRDVCVLYLERLHLMLDTDDPLFMDWDQDAAAMAGRYDEQTAGELVPALVRAAERLASAFDTVGPDEWGRPGRRSDGSEFTIDTFARYFLHDVVHHGWDVTESTA